MGNIEKSNSSPASFLAELISMHMSSQQMNKQNEHRTDCFFYSEEQDMNARIPYCSYHDKYYEPFDCNGCHAHVANKTVRALIKSLVDNGEFDRLEEERDAEG